jgi:hypothetical protein
LAAQLALAASTGRVGFEVQLQRQSKICDRKDWLVEEPSIDVTFGPPAADPRTLSKASRKTLQLLFRHPIAHNLEWTHVVALFERLGTVDQKSHNEMLFGIGGEHHRVHKPHSKDVTVDELLEFRRMLTRAGWSPETVAEADAGENSSRTESAVIPTPPDLLVVVAHHEARIYHLDLQSAETRAHVIRPYDPHHFRHHLTHKDLSRERGQRAPEDPSFYESLAEAIASARAIVVVGHGDGHSNAADRLIDFLRLHHPDTYQKVAREVGADLSSLTPPQLLVLGRRALSSMSDQAAAAQ